MAFELRQLRHFVTVMRLRSFSAAAIELHLTQAALSKSVRLLEQSLGVRLLDRGPGGVTPTPFGERLKGYADLVLTLAAEAQEEVDALRGIRRGSLHIGASHAIMLTLIPAAITSFLKDHPDINVVVREGLNDTLLDLLHSGKLDLAVTPRPAEAPNPDIEHVTLLEEPVWIVSSARHPLARRKAVKLADLAKYAWIVPPRPDPDRLRLEAMLTSAGLDKPRIAMETTSAAFLSSILDSTDHLSYFPRSGFPSGNVSSYGFVRLNLETLTWTRTMSAVYRRQSTMRPALLAFIREIESLCNRWPPNGPTARI